GPGPGYGSTYTSLRPESAEWYATHRPSGEKSGCVDGVFVSGRGALLSRGNTHSGPGRSTIIARPSGAHATGKPAPRENTGTPRPASSAAFSMIVSSRE